MKNCANSNLDKLSDALWFTRITKAAQKHKNAVRAGQLAVLIASKSTVLHLQVVQVIIMQPLLPIIDLVILPG